jgi:hypothetical protein
MSNLKKLNPVVKNEIKLNDPTLHGFRIFNDIAKLYIYFIYLGGVPTSCNVVVTICLYT